MVDFNNETTIGTPATDIEKVNILQRRHDFIEAFEFYKKNRLANRTSPLDIIRARLFSLFLQLQAALKRHKKTDYEELKKQCKEADKEETIIETFLILNEFIDDPLKISRIDTHKQYDSTSVESENKEKGF